MELNLKISQWATPPIIYILEILIKAFTYINFDYKTTYAIMQDNDGQYYSDSMRRVENIMLEQEIAYEQR